MLTSTVVSSVTSILFPVFASYKAIRTGDPALLTPWLMYWTTLSLFLVVESQLYFILYWVPFYAWIRLGLHLYLVAPGKQGSVMLYQEYIHPFLEEHERQIDQTISSTHAKAKAAGLDAIKHAIEYVRVNLLGQAPRQPTPPVSRNVSYSAALLNRFNMPAARSSFVSAAAAAGGAGSTASGDLFNLLGKAMQQYSAPTSTGSRDLQAEDLTRSGTLVPPNLQGAERTDFVNTQRDRLRTLLQAFDQEAHSAPPSPDPTSHSTSRSAYPPSSNQPSSRKPYLAPSQMDGSGYMHKSRSESEFEDLAYEPMPDPDSFRAAPPSRGEGGTPKRESAGWSNFIWGNYGERDSAGEREGRRKEM